MSEHTGPTLKYHPNEVAIKDYNQQDLFVLKSHFNEHFYNKNVNTRVIGALTGLPKGSALVEIKAQMRDVTVVVHRDSGEPVDMGLVTAACLHIVYGFDLDPLDNALYDVTDPAEIESIRNMAREEALMGQRNNPYKLAIDGEFILFYEPFIYTNVSVEKQMEQVNKSAKG